MNRSALRRIGASLIAPAIATGMLVAAPSAQAASNSYAYSAARWLSDQVTGGLVHNPNYGGFDDYGLTIDVFFALKDLDTRSGDRASIISALATNASAYTGSGDTVYAGATGKLSSAAQASGVGGPFGGVDLIAQAEALVAASGRASDTFDPADQYGADYSNTIGQSWVVRALATADSELADKTTEYLLKQQCNDGAFRSAMQDASCTTGAGTIDSTAFAIQALAVAKAEGQADLQDDIDDAVSWLLKQQAANGSFLNDDSANTNSTGLAAATLKSVGQTGAAGSAASWIVSHQVTDAVAEDTLLANELGAIAFDLDALNRGKTGGITDSTRDQWIRASAQATVGVNAQLSTAKFNVTAPTGFIASGSNIAVSATGLAPNEKFAAVVSGGETVQGTANASGVATASVRLPGGTATRTVTIDGARSTRTGVQSVKVLGAKKLSLSLGKSTVKKGKKQTVKLSGLAAGEPLKVYVSGKRVKTAKAYSNGKYSLSVKVTGRSGKKTVKVVGAFTNRTASKKFRLK